MSTITFVPTQRGGTALIFDGYRYNKVRCNNDKNVTYWRCSKNRNCPGRAVTVDNRVKKTNNKHNHPPEAPLPHHHAHHHNPFLNIAAAAAAQHAAAQMRALHQHNHNQSQHQHNQQLNQHHQHQHQQQLPFHSAHNLILGAAAGVGAGQHHQNQHHQQHLARQQSAAVAAAMAQSHAHHQQQHQHQQLSTLISSQLAAAAAAAAVAASAPASSPHQRLSQQAAESQAGAGPLSVDSLLHHAQHQQQQQQQQQQQLQHLTSQQQHQLLAAAFQQHHLLAAVLQQQQQQQQQAQQHNHLTAGNNSGHHPVQQHHRHLLTAAAGATAATGDHELKPRDFRSIGAAAASVSSSTAGAQSHTSNGTSTSTSTKDSTNSCSNPAISANNSADSGKLAASKRPGESAALLNDQTQQARAAPQWPVHVKRESKPMLESGSNSCASSCSPPLSSAGHSRPTSAALLANGTGSDKRLAGDQSSRGEREERSPGFVSPAPSSGGASVGTCASNSAPIEQQQQRRRVRLDHRPESGANSGTSDVDIKPQLQRPASFDCSPSRLDEQLDSADLAGRDTSGRAGAGPGQLGVQLDTSSLAGNTNGRSTPDSSRFNAAPFPSHQQLLTPPASATLTAAATVTSPPESALGGQLNLEQLARFNQQIMQQQHQQQQQQQQHQNQRHNLSPAFSESVQAQIALLSLLGLTNPMQWNPSLNIEH